MEEDILYELESMAKAYKEAYMVSVTQGTNNVSYARISKLLERAGEEIRTLRRKVAEIENSNAQKE